MRLLIITQKVDEKDPGLGFFVRWIDMFAKHASSVKVVCLLKGEYSGGCEVWSLGKEQGPSRFKYIRRFYGAIWKWHNAYDTVFVHMNAEYVVLAGLWWRLMGKKIILWYNHTDGNWKARLAIALSHRVCHTSPYAFTAGYSKSRKMPAGIPTDIFQTGNAEQLKNSVLYIGRIAPAKNVDILLQALQHLGLEGDTVHADIYGDALPRDKSYYDSILKATAQSFGRSVIRVHPGILNSETPKLYSSHEIFVNLTPRGNYDKTVLEAMACGAIPIVSSPAFFDIVPETLRFSERNSQSLADTIGRTLRMTSEERQMYRDRFIHYVRTEHSLAKLGQALYALANEL